MPNRVKPNLPPESAQWGRLVETRIEKSELLARNLATLTNGIKANVASLIGTVGFLRDQTSVVETTPGTLSTLSRTMDSSSDNAYVFLVHNPLWDAVAEFTTSSTGKIMYQAGGFLGITGTGYARVEAMIGVEIYVGNSDFSTANRIIYAPAGGSLFVGKASYLNQSLAAVGHNHLVTLAPYTLYTARTIRLARFTYDAAQGGIQTVSSSFQGASLLISKMGK